MPRASSADQFQNFSFVFVLLLKRSNSKKGRCYSKSETYFINQSWTRRIFKRKSVILVINLKRNKCLIRQFMLISMIICEYWPFVTPAAGPQLYLGNNSFPAPINSRLNVVVGSPTPFG